MSATGYLFTHDGVALTAQATPPAALTALLRERRGLRLAYARLLLDAATPYDEREPRLAELRTEVAGVTARIVAELDRLEDDL